MKDNIVIYLKKEIFLWQLCPKNRYHHGLSGQDLEMWWGDNIN